MSGLKEFLHCLRLALREVIWPAPLEDPDPQSTADATAARTAWVRDHRVDDEEVIRMKKDWGLVTLSN